MMETKTTYRMPVRTSDMVKERLNYLNVIVGMSWREIAKLSEYRGIPAGTLCSYAHGQEPKHKHRQQLGLPPLSEVIVLVGEIPAGCIVLAGQMCECGQAFVSNHPARKRCFICRPWRGKR